MNVIDILKMLLEDTKQDALARELGTSQSTISRWLAGQEPRGMMIEKIKMAAAERGFLDQPAKAAIAGDVAELDIRAGMGNGGLLHVEMDSKGRVRQEYVSGHWAFPDHIKAGMRDLKAIYALPVIGDSMEPTIAGGSVVFVDTKHKFPSPPDIYAVDFGHGLMVKRLEMVPHSKMVRVISDNTRYEEHRLELDDSIHVHGRVVAWFQWRG